MLRLFSLSLLSFGVFIITQINAQNVVQLFTEDFNQPSLNWTLNDTVFGTNSGNNKWIINSEYNGNGLVPNTPSQFSTFGGTISNAPYSGYAHIHDSVKSGLVSNANYDTSSASDRFLVLSNGICTKGLSAVELSFFYIGEGAANSYGEVYYTTGTSTNWIKVGASKYHNKNQWKYEQITDPGFDNAYNLRFAFRWVNDANTSPSNIAFGIDDIHVVGIYDTISNAVDINFTYIDTAVCPGNNLLMSFALSDTLCSGSYHIEMSDQNGNFNPPFSTWITNINYPNTSSFVSLSIPFTAPPASCYKFRVKRISPLPQITSVLSVCVDVQQCPNVITCTDPPVVALDTNPVCISSVIDVPFWSTGVYNSSNIYYAQLSDSSGSFNNPTNIGSLPDNTTYDPALVPSPGMVSGQVPVVPPGCNYYVRVVSSNPNTVGSAWGPFCIQECDISSNNCTDVSACPGDSGTTISIPIDINVWDSLTSYFPGNTFSVEVLDPMSFSRVDIGGLGATIDTQSTTLNLTIPPCDSLAMYGLTTMGFPGGTFYMRIIADSVNDMEQSLGCVVHLSLGCPGQTPYNIVPAFPWSTLSDTVLCVGDPIFVRINGYNPSSSFMYFIDGNSFPPNNPPVMLGIYWTSTGIHELTLQETHIGCDGPLSNPLMVYVTEAPQTVMLGPDTICINDTADYLVQFYNATYYDWNTSYAGSIVDTGNNEISVLMDSAGTFTISVFALNTCGNSNTSINVEVVDHIGVSIVGDSLGCEGDSLLLNADGFGSFSWQNIQTGPSYMDLFTLYEDTVILTAQNHCGTFYDTLGLIVIPTSLLDLGPDTTIYVGQQIELSSNLPGNYLWSPSNYLDCIDCALVTASPTEDITYSLTIDTLGCISYDDILIKVELAGDIFVPNLFTPNDDGLNDVLAIYGHAVDEIDFKIFDRWGEVVFHSQSINATWDGTFNGKPLNSAVFVYSVQVTYIDGREQTQQGNITLIR